MPTFMNADYEPLWYWIREREAIRVRKELGQPFPWTTDPILRDYRFCCARREDDRVTQWIRSHVRERFARHPHLWLMLCICRQINWPDTLAELIACPGAWPLDDSFYPDVLALILNKRKILGDKVYTGAYMIPAPHERGADKQAHIARVVIGDLWRRRDEFVDWTSATLEGTHARIAQTPGWGNFLAYQAVVDMRFTPLLAEAPDVSTWAAAGPGTIRGLNRLHGRPLDMELKQPLARQEMREIYEIATRETSVMMDFSDVPNVLCETDKYLRVKLGQGKPRAKYVPGRGA
jgi:hypothetical protein